jgi:hypothetical protein
MIKDSLWITFAVPLHKSVPPRSCSSKINDTMCICQSFCFKNDYFCRNTNSAVSVAFYPVLHLFFYVRSFCNMLMKEESLFFCNCITSSSCLFHLCIILCVGGGPKCLLAILLPWSFTYFITFNFEPTLQVSTKFCSCFKSLLHDNKNRWKILRCKLFLNSKSVCGLVHLNIGTCSGPDYMKKLVQVGPCMCQNFFATIWIAVIILT